VSLGRLVFGMTGAEGVTGGIASANQNILRALSDLSKERAVPLTVLSYHEDDDARPSYLSKRDAFRGMRGSRVRFARELAWRAARKDTVFLDHVALARPLLPFGRTAGRRTVIFAHGSESWRRVRTQAKTSFRAAELCLTNSDFTLRKMRETFDGFRGQACPLGLPPSIELNERPPEQQDPAPVLEAADGVERPIGDRSLLLVARLHPGEREKGHTQLIEALPDLKRRFPDVQLVFPGPGEDRTRLGRLAIGCDVADSVFLPGYLPTDELGMLYAHSYAYVMPSKQEGFGLTYLEAMNFAKPCVGSRDDGAEDVIVDGETGFLVADRDDQASLVEVLSQMLSDPDAAARMGVAGLKRLNQRFTAGHFQKRIRDAVGPLL